MNPLNKHPLLVRIEAACALSHEEGETVRNWLVIGAGMDLYTAARRQRKDLPYFNIKKAVTSVKKHGYSDLAIIAALDRLINVQCIVPTTFGNWATDEQPFPMVTLNLDSEDDGRHAILAELSGRQDEYVDFVKMRDGMPRAFRDKAGCW